MKARLALALASLTLALGLAEVAFRWVRPLWAVTYPPVCALPELFQRWDPYGYRLWPSSERNWVSHVPGLERLVPMTANAAGFRSRRELDAPDARPRIVVVGDSMVFGAGVLESERFTERMEALAPEWRVDNLGMIGFGTDLMLRALEAVGLEPAPAVVVFAVFSDDLRRVAPTYQGPGFPLPRFVLDDAGRLVTVPYPAPRPWERLRLVQAVQYLRFRYGGAAYPLNDAILARYRALATERRFRPVLAFLPPPTERFDDGRRRRWLGAWAQAHDVPFVDVTPAVAAADAYLPGDTHFGPAGHARVAELLVRFLATALPSGTLPSPPVAAPAPPVSAGRAGSDVPR